MAIQKVAAMETKHPQRVRQGHYRATARTRQWKSAQYRGNRYPVTSVAPKSHLETARQTAAKGRYFGHFGSDFAPSASLRAMWNAWTLRYLPKTSSSALANSAGSAMML